MYALLPNSICFCSLWSVFLILSAILMTDNSISVNGLEQSERIFRRQDTKTTAPTLKTSSSTLSPPPASSSCSPSSNGANSSSSCNNSTNNSSNSSGFYHFANQFQKNKGMLLRTLYVLIAITSIVVIYFAVKSLRLRRRRSKSKKYGIITTPASDLEMAPLDQGDDDDEDMTVFELNGKPK